MKRGEVEKQCFEYIKSEMLSKDICYVCSIEDEELIKNTFQTTMPNCNPNDFPDFVFQNGFIEHFEVTSSHSNRNGSTMKIEQHSLRKEAEDNEKVLMEKMSEMPCYKGETVITDKWHSKHSYNDFCFSFKKNWEKHIDSLEKYTGDKNIGIFMIQYNDSALVLDVILPNEKTELYYGDLIERPQYKGYRLTLDSATLEYIYQFKDKIKYVVFYNNDVFHGKRCEIICVENIPEILKIVKGKYSYHCVLIGSANVTCGISTPNPLYGECDKNEQT